MPIFSGSLFQTVRFSERLEGGTQNGELVTRYMKREGMDWNAGTVTNWFWL